MKPLLTLVVLAFALATLARIASAQLIWISPVIPADTNGFPAYVLVAAQQLSNNICTIQASATPDFLAPFDFAIYGCYVEDQWVFGSFPIEFYPQTFFRALNTPCK